MLEITIAKEIIVSIAAIITASAALKGLDVWRTQLKGKNEYLLAKRILQKSYEFQEVLKGVRSPFISVGELQKRREVLGEEKIKNETEKVTAILDESFAYFERFKNLQKVVTDLRVSKYEAVALWGKEKVKDVEALIGKEKELFISYDMYISGRLQGWDEKEERQKYYETLYYIGDNDKFAKEVEEILNKIELLLRKYI